MTESIAVSNLTIRRDDVITRTKHTITSWTAHWPELSLEGKGPTIPAALRDLAVNIESHALTELTRIIEEAQQ